MCLSHMKPNGHLIMIRAPRIYCAHAQIRLDDLLTIQSCPLANFGPLDHAKMLSGLALRLATLLSHRIVQGESPNHLIMPSLRAPMLDLVIFFWSHLMHVYSPLQLPNHAHQPTPTLVLCQRPLLWTEHSVLWTKQWSIVN